MVAQKASEEPRPVRLEEGPALLAHYDFQNDAFGDFPLVPRPAASEFLMAYGLRTGVPLALKAALRSLAVLPKSELADPVEGGFFERCLQARWKHPYTRKTLAGNAGLLRAFSTAAGWTGERTLRQAAADTATFIDTHLKADGGDLWVAFQGPDDDYFEKMGTARSKLEAPPKGGPADTASSAVAISAFVRAGLALDEARWIGRAKLAARELFDSHEPTNAEGTVAMAHAALDLDAATGEGKWITFADELLERTAIRLAGLPPTPHAFRRAALPIAHLMLGLARSGVETHDKARVQVARMADKLELDEGDIEGMSALGMAKLAGLWPPVEVRCRGARAEAPGASAVRHALAAAWALGPPRPWVEGTDERKRARGEFAFAGPSGQSPWSADPAAAKELLRSVVDVREGL